MMRIKICSLVMLLLVLLSVPAQGQPGPIYFIEHDWTFRVGNSRFGIFKDRWLGDEKYGGGSHITIYAGKASLRLKSRSFNAGSFAILSIGAISACMFCILTLRDAKLQATGRTSNRRSGISASDLK